MNPRKVRWNLAQGNIDHLSMALKPIRSYEEVAKILCCSDRIVRHLETSALRKIVRAMSRFEINGNTEP